MDSYPPNVASVAEVGRALRREGAYKKVNVTLPGKQKLITVKRTGPELAQLFTSQRKRGLFETGIVTTVSRVEAFIQECMVIAVSAYPQKLSIISEKSGIPLGLFLEHENREDLLARYVAFRCQNLMFGKPSEYLEKACAILNIKLDQKLIDTYIEIKATRDIIVHGSGKINQLYVEKAGKKRRGEVGDDLVVDIHYAKHVFLTAKSLASAFKSEAERIYGKSTK